MGFTMGCLGWLTRRCVLKGQFVAMALRAGVSLRTAQPCAMRSAARRATSARAAGLRVQAASGKSYTLTLLPGDGIGPEIIKVAVDCLNIVVRSMPRPPQHLRHVRINLACWVGCPVAARHWQSSIFRPRAEFIICSCFASPVHYEVLVSARLSYVPLHSFTGFCALVGRPRRRASLWPTRRLSSVAPPSMRPACPCQMRLWKPASPPTPFCWPPSAGE